jgi:ATP-binding cassette subfamily C protein
MLALARIVLADPEFVVLDEATAEAGSSGAQALETAAQAVLVGRGGLVVAHRLSQAVTADRVLVMAHGRVVESGPHAQLSRGEGLYARLWEAWTAR